MENSINAVEQLRQKLKNIPGYIKQDFIQKYVERKKACDLFIKKMQNFLEMHSILVEECIKINQPEMINPIRPKNYP